jgi:hypothetical protein
MTVTADMIYERLPGVFTDSADERLAIDACIAEAQRRCDPTTWGTLYDDGVLYLAAHLRSLTKPSNAAVSGANSMSAGGVSMTFGGASGAGGAYRSGFLDQYEALRRLVVLGPMQP